MRASIGRVVLLVSLAMMSATGLATATDSYTVSGRIFGTAYGPDGILRENAALESTKDVRVVLFALPGAQAVATVGADPQGRFAFEGVAPGDYMIQVTAPGLITAKRQIVVDAQRAASNRDLEFTLRRPLDFGPDLQGVRAAGATYAFGCVNISLVFVQFQGGSTWSATDINNVMQAGQNAMASFQTQAPPGARVRGLSENLGTFTVTSPVGGFCGEADAWVDEVLTQMGFTTGSFDDRVNQLSDQRRDAACGTSPRCGGCGNESSSFLFFISRDNSTSFAGGWNCGGYLISYYGNSFGQQVYLHEVGHGFGTMDEYCIPGLPGTDYCCGWVGGAWGCTDTSGCLSQTNDNCDPVCGGNCDGVDCQDSCPNANCTSHIPCVMDGGPTMTFCQFCRRAMGWADTDGDAALDCMESDCGTNPGDATSTPGCLNAGPAASAGDDVEVECSGTNAGSVLLGSESTDPDDDPLACLWSSATCTFDDPGDCIVQATCPPGNNTVTLTVTDPLGGSSSDSLNFEVRDTTPPHGAITAPADGLCTAGPVTITDNFTDVCDPALDRTYTPPPGPTYTAHGDYLVTLEAVDDVGNTSHDAVSFTIDTNPPTASITRPPAGSLLLPSMFPLDVVLGSADADGAAGGVVHEVLTLDGCVLFDGAIYGDGDGLLSDESVELSQAALCDVALRCGFSVLNQPVLRVDVTDCAANTATAQVQLAGSIKLLPGICGP